MKKLQTVLLATATALTLANVSQQNVVAWERDRGELQPVFTQVLSESSAEICFSIDSKGGVKQNTGFIEEETDLVIPSTINGSGVSSIQMQGFYGLENLLTIALPTSVSTIGDQAFAECPSLQLLMIPASVVSIGSDILLNSHATVYTYSGSYAEAYCVENGISFRILDTEPEPEVEDTQQPQVEEDVPQVEEEDVYVAPESEEFIMPDGGKVATPSTAKMEIDGTAVDLAAYNIDGFNYFRLTDLAYALTGTTSQFNVVWDQEKLAINVVTGASYSVQGDEFQPHSGRNEVALPFVSDTYIAGEVSPITVYIIDGKSYFQLNDLSIYLDFALGWNATTSTISLITPEEEGDLVVAYADLVDRIQGSTLDKIYLVLDLDKVTNLTEEQKEKLVEVVGTRVPSTVTVVASNEEKLKSQGMMQVTVYGNYLLQEFPLGNLLTFENTEKTENGFQCTVGTYYSHVKTDYSYYSVEWNGEEFFIYSS